MDSNVTTTALYTGKLIDGLNVGGNKAAAVKAYDNDDNGKIDTVVYVPSPPQGDLRGREVLQHRC